MEAVAHEVLDHSWVGNQCWSNTACSAIGIAWSADGSTWASAEHLVVQHDPRAQCGLVSPMLSSGRERSLGSGRELSVGPQIRTPLGIVPEPAKCKGCYSVIFTGWGAPEADHTDVDASSLSKMTTSSSSSPSDILGRPWASLADRCRCFGLLSFQFVVVSL